MMTRSISDETFDDDVLKSKKPVLVDFWATWCGPCKAITSSIDDLGAEFSGQLEVVKLDIDDNPETPTKYGVRSVPTLMIFVDGESVATRTGAASKSVLAAWIKSSLPAGEFA